MKVQLFKEETRSDAEYPQEEKYPSSTVIATGSLIDDQKPVVDQPFYMKKDTGSLSGYFRTSTVREILESTEEYIRFKTRNSVYKLILNP